MASPTIITWHNCMNYVTCAKCGRLAYYNSHFGRMVCGHCGWTDKKPPLEGKA